MSAPIDVVKFPRTPHVEGSALQPGDDDQPLFDEAQLAGTEVVVTEKLDGANVGLRFDPTGRPWLFSRSHLLGNEVWFDRLKAQVAASAAQWFELLGSGVVLYGEWLLPRHTVFYDALPAYWIVFDAFDLERGEFFGADAHKALLERLGLSGPPLVWRGRGERLPEVSSLVGRSAFVSPNLSARFDDLVRERGLSLPIERAQTELTGSMEGVVVRLERAGRFVGRCKYVRPGFRQTIADSKTHWASRPFVPNLLSAVRP